MSLENIFRRDRAVILFSLASITVVCWAYMIHEARGMTQSGICSCMGVKMGSPDRQGWSVLELLALFIMWTEMMIAMMVPTAAPMILTFAAINRQRRAQELPFVITGLFLLGYLVVWTGFSVLAALAQWGLHAAALLSPTMVGTSPIFGGLVLVLAGVFQWSPLKRRCLTHCRSPLSFLLTDWREGKLGAVIMGFKHGIFCTGCCWLLMLLLFVAGVMNILWIAALTSLVLLEKVAPQGSGCGKIAGMIFILWGIWMITHTPLS